MVAPYVRTRIDQLVEIAFLAVVFAIVLLAGSMLVGCTSKPARVVIREPIEVRVPVAVKPAPPHELLEPLQHAALPEFIAPCEESASSALSPDGERNLKHLLLRLETRLKEWKAWAITDTQEQ